MSDGGQSTADAPAKTTTALPPFGFVGVHEHALNDGIAREAEWMQRCAATGRATAWLWHAGPGWVVPRRYTALPGWSQALASLRPGSVQVRASGGGLVPQGPGVWNLTLVWPATADGATASDAIYRALCSQIATALDSLGIVAVPGAVNGSFCDGRYNLAVQGRKLVGTAQAWRRIGGRQIALAHAVVIVSADPARLVEEANAFEAALGTNVRYRAEVHTSVAQAAGRVDIERDAIAALARQFARVVLPV